MEWKHSVSIIVTRRGQNPIRSSFEIERWDGRMVKVCESMRDNAHGAWAKVDAMALIKADAAEVGVTLAEGDIVWDLDEDAQLFRRHCASDLYVHRFDPFERVTPERLHHLDGVDLPKLVAQGA